MIKIFATNTRSKERFEIDDMYWFEENFIHDLNQKEHFLKQQYTFEIFIDDVKVWETPDN